MNSFSVSAPRPTDKKIDEVIALWRKNSATLGFFPDGAFRDCAERKELLVATDQDEVVVGYLAYRRAYGRAVIVHLCVSPSSRGSGVARQLVNALCQDVQDCSAVSLRCRSDFPATRLWPKLQFEPVKEIPGRGRNSVLVVWRRDLGRPDLFRWLGKEGSRIRVALDANVFFDLRDESRMEVESRALLADWLTDIVDLYVTPELSNEFLRNPNPEERARHRAVASEFEKCEQSSEGAFEGALQLLAAVLPCSARASDDSDRRHLAWAVASKVDYFLTRDDALLGAADGIYRSSGLKVIRPSELVLRIDELERREEYAPASLAGTPLKWMRSRAGDESRLADALHFGLRGESRSEFIRRIRQFASDPRRYESRIVSSLGECVAVMVLDRQDSDSVKIPLLRLGKTHSRPTLARHLLFKAQVAAGADGRQVLEYNDSTVDDEVAAALRAEGWMVDRAGVWRRWCFRFVGSVEELEVELRQSAVLKTRAGKEFLMGLSGLLNGARNGSGEATACIERVLWPAKILGAGLATFLVPIAPWWAQHIVDERLAAGGLFGARDDLALNREAVYYRSPNRPSPSAPARVLWYVSDDGIISDVKAVRAVSFVDDVGVASAREIFRRNRRLGVYEWRDVKKVAGGDPDGRVMAVRFSNTELFDRPIGRASLHDILRRHGKGLMTAGPMRLDDSVFSEIYRAGGLG